MRQLGTSGLSLQKYKDILKILELNPFSKVRYICISCTKQEQVDRGIKLCEGCKQEGDYK